MTAPVFQSQATDIETKHTSTIKIQKRLLNEQTHERIQKKEAEKQGLPYIPTSDVDLEATITIPSFQDQGFTRAKVLVLLPFRYYAYVFVHCLLGLLPERMQVLGKSKFEEEFSEEPDGEEKQPKWKEYFPGNNDGRCEDVSAIQIASALESVCRDATSNSFRTFTTAI